MRPPSPRRRSVGRVPHYARAASRLRDNRRTRASRHAIAARGVTHRVTVVTRGTALAVAR